MSWGLKELMRLFSRKASGMDINNLGAVMWPVVYPNMLDPAGDRRYQPKNPHITIVVFKDINNPELGFTLQDVIDSVMESQWNVFLWCKPEGIEWFGPDANIPVLRVHHDYLSVYRESIIEILSARGIQVDNTFPEYKPHITITDDAAIDGVYPNGAFFAAPVEVWWGGEHYNFGLDEHLKIQLNRDGSV